MNSYKIEAPSEENNELPKNPNKIWREFVKKEYDNDKGETEWINQRIIIKNFK